MTRTTNSTRTALAVAMSAVLLSAAATLATPQSAEAQGGGCWSCWYNPNYEDDFGGPSHPMGNARTVECADTGMDGAADCYESADSCVTSGGSCLVLTSLGFSEDGTPVQAENASLLSRDDVMNPDDASRRSCDGVLLGTYARKDEGAWSEGALTLDI